MMVMFCQRQLIKLFVLLSRKQYESIKDIAIDLNDGLEINLGDPIELSDNVWTNYVRGVVNQLQLKDLSLKVSTVHSAYSCGFRFVIICSFGMWLFYLD
jgi:hypothetical protein